MKKTRWEPAIDMFIYSGISSDLIALFSYIIIKTEMDNLVFTELILIQLQLRLS